MTFPAACTPLSVRAQRTNADFLGSFALAFEIAPAATKALNKSPSMVFSLSFLARSDTSRRIISAKLTIAYLYIHFQNSLSLWQPFSSAFVLLLLSPLLRTPLHMSVFYPPLGRADGAWQSPELHRFVLYGHLFYGSISQFRYFMQSGRQHTSTLSVQLPISFSVDFCLNHFLGWTYTSTRSVQFLY